MKVTIEKKAFELRFGFKCLKQLGKKLGFKSYNEVVNHLSILDNMGTDVSFEQDDLIEALIISAAEAHPGYEDNPNDITEVSIMDWVITQPEQFAEVVKHLVESMPQGKPQPVKKSRQAKKKP